MLLEDDLKSSSDLGVPNSDFNFGDTGDSSYQKLKSNDFLLSDIAEEEATIVDTETEKNSKQISRVHSSELIQKRPASSKGIFDQQKPTANIAGLLTSKSVQKDG